MIFTKLIWLLITKCRAFIRWLYTATINYNLFIPDAEDINNLGETEGSEAALKRQRYTTRVYILLLLGKYILLQF